VIHPDDHSRAGGLRPPTHANLALIARMAIDRQRAAIISQHAARGADEASPEALDAHAEAGQADGEDGAMARRWAHASRLMQVLVGGHVALVRENVILVVQG
jgi:hypothetical protein